MNMLPNHLSSRPVLLLALTLAGLGPQFASAQQSLAPPAAFNVAEPLLDIRSFVIDGKNPLSDAETASLLAPFTGEKRALSQIEQAAVALEKAMRAEGYAFHRVFVPVQKPVDGKVTLQIIQFTVGAVSVTGNEHFSSDNIRRSLPTLLEGSVPDIRDIGADLTAGNSNPAKHVTVTFKESAKPDSVDAALKVKDADPLSYFVGYTGNLPVGNKNPDDSLSRVTVGFQHANLFDKDHVASLSYTTDPTKIDKVTLFGAYYQFPIYGRGLNLSAYYTNSNINSGAAAPGGPDVTGRGQFMGVRLNKSLPRSGPLMQTVSIALDDKHFESDLPNTIAGLPDQNVGSRPLSARYNFRREEPWGSVGGNVEYAFNLDGGTSNSDANYAGQVLAPADQKWQAWRYGLDLNVREGVWSYTARLRGQLSSNSLIAGEKFSLGGVGSVRGFADSRVRGDYGVLWNFEALGPELFTAQLRPVIFMDGGQVGSNGLLSGVTESLLSVGTGLRWNYQKFELSADLAYVLKADSAETVNNPIRLHVSAIYRF
jgi:hemolysin activation/secretion protein